MKEKIEAEQSVIKVGGWMAISALFMFVFTLFYLEEMISTINKYILCLTNISANYIFTPDAVLVVKTETEMSNTCKSSLGSAKIKNKPKSERAIRQCSSWFLERVCVATSGNVSETSS